MQFDLTVGTENNYLILSLQTIQALLDTSSRQEINGQYLKYNSHSTKIGRKYMVPDSFIPPPPLKLRPPKSFDGSCHVVWDYRFARSSTILSLS